MGLQKASKVSSETCTGPGIKSFMEPRIKSEKEPERQWKRALGLGTLLWLNHPMLENIVAPGQAKLYRNALWVTFALQAVLQNLYLKSDNLFSV